MTFSRNKIISSFIWKLSEKIGVQGISLVVSLVIARILSPDAYGSIALVMVFLSLANVIVEGGFTTALIQKKNADAVDFSTIFYFSLLIGLVFYAILYITSPLIADFYDKPELVKVIRVLSVSLPLYAINSVQRAYISKHLLFKKQMLCSFISIFFSGSIGIYLAYSGFGIWALVFQSIALQVCTIVVMFFIIKWRPRLSFSFSRFKALFDYGWKIFASSFMISAFLEGRSLIIGKMYSASTLAFFDRGKQLPCLIMNNINASIQAVIFPVFSSIQDDVTQVKSMMRKTTQMSCFIIFPILIGLAVCAKPLIIAILTEKWIGAVPFVQIFCVAYMLMPVQIANMEAIKSLGYSNITLKIETIKKILEVTILLISLNFGAIAIALGVVIYNAICLFINLYPNIKILNYSIKEQLLDLVPSLFASIIMGAGIFWIQYINIPNILVLILQILLGIVIYYSVASIFKIQSLSYLVQIIINNKKI